MSNNKKYFWLKLKNDFFNQKTIKKLRKIAGGDTYTIIYLKMQLASIQNNGKLIFEGIENTFAEELALELDEDLENIKVTLAYLESNKLIEIVEDDKYLLTAVPDVIGAESAVSERVRKHRANKKALQCNTGVTKCNTEIEIDKDKDKDIDKDIDLDIDIDKEKKIEKEIEKEIDVIYCQDDFLKNYLNNINPIASPLEIEKLTSWEENIDRKLINKAIEIAVINNARKYSYINAILNNWLKDNIKTFEQYESLERIKQQEKDLKNERSNKKCSNGTEKPTADDFKRVITENQRKARM